MWMSVGQGRVRRVWPPPPAWGRPDWNSAVAVASGVDGLAIMPRFGTIKEVVASVYTLSAVATGTTTVDVNRGTGTLSTTPYQVTFGTIFTTQANRPMIGQ